MSDYIMFYASDYRLEYMANIKRVIALPEGAIFKLRYQAKYIDENLYPLFKDKTKINYIKKQLSFIAFTKGNIPDTETESNSSGQPKKKLIHFPIRFAKIARLDFDEETELFYCYLKLESFCALSKNENNPTSDKLRISKYSINLEKSTFKKLVCNLGENNVLGKSTFVHIDSITCQKRLSKIKLKDDNDYRSSYYCRLYEGKYYNIRILAYSPISIISYSLESSTDMYLLKKSENTHELKIDGFDHTIKALKSDEELNRANLLITVPENKAYQSEDYIPYSVSVDFIIKKSYLSVLLFSLFVLMSALGLFFITSSKVNANVNDVFNFSWLQIIIGSVLLFVSTSYLYMNFNKK